jgi:broad specificity phosphatase PhoE
MEIYLLRHAQSEGNKQGIFQGTLDYPLSEEGIRQTEKGVNFLKNIPFEVIISSPQKRALQTAQIISERLNLPLKTDDRIREISYGILEGVKHEEVKGKDFYLKWLENPVKYPIEGVTDFKGLDRTLEKFLRELLKKNYKKVLVVTHGGIIRAIACKLTGIGYENLWRFSVGNLSLSKVEIKDRENLKGKIKFWNLPTFGLEEI